MSKRDYISAMDNIQFKENLKQETIRKIKEVNKFYISVNWKYKLLIVTTAMQMYFLSFGILTCR